MQQIVIVGGGAVGSSSAFHLASHPRFKGRITVVERDPTYRIASSSLSASSIRQQFSTPVNIAMSQYGLEFLRHGNDTLAVRGEKAQLGLLDRGYLFLATEAGMPVLRENHAVQKAAGADVAILSPGELKARFPWINVDDVAGGSLGLAGEGWFDGPALLAAYRRKARSLGVEYIAQDATGFARAGDKVTGVKLADGSVLPCDIAVNAAGPWSARVAAFAGIDLPVRARKRMIYVFSCPDKLPGLPLLIDHPGYFVRPEGAGFLCGRSPDEGELDPDEPPLVVEDAMFNDIIWPQMAARIPALENLRITGAWAGYYEYNIFDFNGVIGPHPAVPNLIFATGFSGHGMQHSPATGRGVAELIAEGGFTSLDLSPLSFDRIVEGRPLIEQGIV